MFAEPLAVALRMRQQVAVRPDASVAVIRAVDVGALIDRAYRLRDCIAALDYARRPGVRKVLLRP